MPTPTTPYDLTIIGAGLTGTALARHLSTHTPPHPMGPRLALLDASDDIGNATSKANTAILHTGFDTTPGTLESRLVRDGHRRLLAHAQATGIPVEPVGALLIAWTEDQLAALPALAAKAVRNGVHDTRPLTPAELYAREPHLGPGALGALHVPGESIICPFTTPLSYATEAVRAGVDLHLNTRVERITLTPEGHELHTNRGTFRTHRLVNAAGLHADTIDRLLGIDDFTITPRRGQLLVFAKQSRQLVRHILLPVPTALGKGVLITPTVFGNVLLGPTAEDLTGPDARTANHTTPEGIAHLLEHGRHLMPALLDTPVITSYAGLRTATEHDDYRIRAHPHLRYLTIGGIRSTGLSASLGIAAHAAGLLAEDGFPLADTPGPAEPPRMPNLGESFPRPHQRPDLIAQDPAYGDIVCPCENVTRGEIRDALTATVPARTPGGLRRRTRVQAGHCRGELCSAAVRALTADHIPDQP
ncbi:FAD/NAD(P)-binding oxidoreductase [Streptomyces spiroverticillatus]|uniref:FAD/NAD(P)-binding oxidoreductase n=1 Tax=Streptomyces finlayi TaxID=67296 RepID=A0A919CAN9_9ACTN|nr:NAD(P)/FAD-dependent oxidoreductase [Streptomyces finlayi]GHA15511.1 FAD/NAD(P)-binding oxidoreductase [Streptomyces spiroverticillatus]GHC96700.1 FAD/NAD(P)-binding oxidoreductase [Streptomyces finlayi]